MRRFSRIFLVFSLALTLSLGSLPSQAVDYSGYQQNYGDARWLTKLNNFIAAVQQDVTSLGAQMATQIITQWAQIVNLLSSVDSLTLIPGMPTYSDDHTFTLPGDYSSLLTAGKRLVADCAADGLKPNTVVSCTYASSNSTVVVTNHNLTSNLAAVSYYATRNGVNTYGSGDIVAGDFGAPSWVNLQSAVSMAAAAGRRLILTPGSWPVSDNLTIGCPVMAIPGATFAIATTKTLTLSKYLEAGPSQVFTWTGSGKVSLSLGTVIPQWWGAVGTGDDTAVVQASITCAKSSGLPFYWNAPVINLYSASIDCTGSAVEGWQVYGLGKQATLINIHLASAYPALDFTGSQGVCLHDFKVLGITGGSQTAGILVARDNATGRGDVTHTRDLVMDGFFSAAALANVSSDQMEVDDTTIINQSSTGVPQVVAATDYLSVGSAYKTFASVTGNTKHYFKNVDFIAYHRACIVYKDGAAITTPGCYFSLLGDAVAMIETVETPGSKSLYLDSACRGESNSSASNTSVLNLGGTSIGGSLKGQFAIQGTGPWINLPSGQNLTDYDIEAQGGTAKLISGGGGIQNCTIRNPNNLPADLPAPFTCWNNIVFANTNTPWANFAVAGTSNIWMGQTAAFVGALSVAGTTTLGGSLDLGANDLNLGTHAAYFGSGQTTRFDSNGSHYAAAYGITWSSDAHAYDTADTSISRGAAGTVYFGTGAMGNSDGTVMAGNMILKPLSAAPTNATAGMIALANRANWDPLSKGSGGPYQVWYNGTAWVSPTSQ